MSTLPDIVAKRRTFAIISHPDAGKTTLTEKLLLFGGAIQMAGAVKARGEARRATSDWMKVERERGISVASSVMTYDYGGHTFNLLDTPGHEDFSEDTYRTLTAVDSAVMVIDAAKGIETQTRKLFEVCRLRDMPIVTFVNKMDREARDPFDVLDEIEQALALDVTPASWPIGMGKSFLGVYDLINDRLVLMSRSKGEKPHEGESCEGLDDPKLDELLPADAVATLREQVEMARGLCKPFDLQSYREGHLTPVFFGSAINNFGVRELLNGIGEYAPSPRPAPTLSRSVEPAEPKVAGFVFKIQANMDPKHRDRIAFLRLCSGHFKRGMKLKQIRTGKQLTLHNAVLFLAQDRELAEGSLGRGTSSAFPTTATCISATASPRARTCGSPACRLSRRKCCRRCGRRTRSRPSTWARRCSSSPRKERRGCSSRTWGRTGSSAWSARCSSTSWPTVSAPNTTCR